MNYLPGYTGIGKLTPEALHVKANQYLMDEITTAETIPPALTLITKALGSQVCFSKSSDTVEGLTTM